MPSCGRCTFQERQQVGVDRVASVVAMPCGKPLSVFNVLFLSNFADSGAESA
jgi:hypothetical protein